MTGELLFEIGTEEIPSDYQKDALQTLLGLAQSLFEEYRIDTGDGLETFGTPRRIVLLGRGVAKKQGDAVQEVTGPPKKAAFDSEGNPTKAALGFAKKQGVPVDELEFLDTPKGPYLFVRRNIPGGPTAEVLTELLPRLIKELPWPKSMRWGSLGVPFVRPVHWILALFAGGIVPFETAGVRSGETTWGHRFMAAGPREAKGIEGYLKAMRDAKVIIDPVERTRMASEAVQAAARAVDGIPMQDEELLETVTNMTEWPSAVCGAFDEAFLDLPDPVLITAMKKHQKYFSVHDAAGHLMPYFVAVNNTLARDEDTVRKGHERVLRARLADADFFFKEDRKRPLEARLDDLKKVIYQADLGTSYAKVQRFARLGEYLADGVAPRLKDRVSLAAKLCKCDLETEMVMEFTSLQGVMGREYARLDGHPEDVCLAIQEHYLPDRAGGDLPSSPVGAVVGLADRMDTISGCFAVGLEPTGAADPFALRRHALAIIRISEHFGWNISLREFITASIATLREDLSFDGEGVFERVLDFFRERYKQMMLRAGHSSDLVEAVLSSHFDHITQPRLQIDQLERFISTSEDFEPLVLTVKRVSNILKRETSSGDVDPTLLKEDPEKLLWEAFGSIKDAADQRMAEKDYLGALTLMARLRKPVDDLFEGVEILTKQEPALRNNRVALLRNLSDFFLGLADFSKFSI